MFRALRLCGVSCLVVAASACVDDAVPPSGPTRAKIIAQAQTDWSRAADLQISEAVRGRKERGEQETMLQIEARAPGFGGYYIDSTDQVVVHLKNNSESSATAVRHVLDSVYSRRGEPARSVMSRAFDAKVVPSAFALSELIAIEQHIYKSGVLRGMTGVGTSIVANRVKVGFENESAGQVQKSV